jgi:hypothetical protein
VLRFDGLFELDLFLADAMRFVPVELSLTNRTIRQPDDCDALHLSPSAGAVFSVEATPVTNTAA